MRGTGVRIVEGEERVGITPADAGNSADAPSAQALCGDHPRGCGEQPACACVSMNLKGSPPRMRGTGVIALGLLRGERITPADAGNSPSPRRGLFCL